MNSLAEKQNIYIDIINNQLYSYIKKSGEQYDIVKDAMLYSLSAGGKRIRPILTLEFALLNGGSIEKALPFACAVEMIHCYSLIHDDLPCMDDDDFRRGKPSCHKQFGEANALLAGDALLTLAFETISSADIEPSLAIKAVRELSNLSGINGMVGGQVIDLENEGKKINQETLYKTHLLKTSALISCACLLGAISANADDEAINNAREYGKNLGLAFQIVDDILDVCGDEKTLGKPIGSDNENGKTTFVSLFSLNGAIQMAETTTNNALIILNKINGSENLITLTKNLLHRRN